MILFSGISPTFQQSLKEELFNCFKYIHIPYSELMTMPTKDRKFYIQRHNKVTEEENRKMEGKNSMSLDGAAINNAADMALHRT